MSGNTQPLSVLADDTTPLYSAFVDSLYARIEHVSDVLVYSSTYLVIIAMAEVVTAMLALSLPLGPAPVVVGLITFAVYVGDRIADVEADEAEKPEQSAFMRRHHRLLSVLSAGAYGLAITISILGGPVALGVTLLPGTLWVLYASDWLPSVNAQFQRLKDVFLVNSTLVALAWATAIVLLPLTFADAPFTPTAAVAFAYFFVDSFINTEIPNVRDRAEDAALGVSTLPVVLGVRRTRHVLYGLNLLLIALVGYAALTGLFSLALATGLAVGFGYALVVIAFVGRTPNPGRVSIAGESKSLLVVVAVAFLLAVGL